MAAAELSPLELARIEVQLKCPRCDASNRPGATYVDLNPHNGEAVCIVCAHGFFVDLPGLPALHGPKVTARGSTPLV